MNLLHEIQSSLVDGADLNSIFLKLRYLAAKLGSDPLDEWVKHESEGYPDNAEVSSYRVVPVTYRGTFLGPFQSIIKNAQIPAFIIEQCAGKEWTNHKFRQSIAALDELVKGAREGHELGINASDLLLLLQGKMYSGYLCIGARGIVSRASLVGIQNVVRNRILEFTLKLEKTIPAAAGVTLGTPEISGKVDPGEVTNIYHQTIYGGVTAILNSGKGNQLILSSISKGDRKALIECLVKAGIPETDASELAEIAASDELGDSGKSLGPKTRKWLDKNLQKAIGGAWKIGRSAAESLVTEALLRYFGLK